MTIPESIRKFIDAFSSLPSIGPRQAHRLAFHIRNLELEKIHALADALRELSKTKTCAQCFFVYDPRESKSKNNLCAICANPGRVSKTVMIVEKETDLITVERTKKFLGRYLVLGDLRRDGVLGAEERGRLSLLKKQASAQGIFEEIIIAVSPTTAGDINASLILQELKGVAKKITRLGRGLPVGGEVEFADEDTLGSAIDNRS